jgi:hypothetical protein
MVWTFFTCVDRVSSGVAFQLIFYIFPVLLVFMTKNHAFLLVVHAYQEVWVNFLSILSFSRIVEAFFKHPRLMVKCRENLDKNRHFLEQL